MKGDGRGQKKHTQEEVDKKALYQVHPHTAVIRGLRAIEEPGTLLGWYWTADATKPDGRKEWPIVSCGLIEIGTGKRVLACCIGQRWAFLVRDGKIARVKKFAFTPTPAPIHGMTREARLIWADGVARAFVDKMTTPHEWLATEAGLHRYRKLVRAFVDARVIDAAALGHSRSVLDYARACSADWTHHALLMPRYASIQHAMMVCLTCALPAERAAELVELAALLEYKITLVDRPIARDMVARMYHLMTLLCPEWASAGYLTTWPRIGTIDRLFKAHYARLLYGVQSRALPYDAGEDVRMVVQADPITQRGGIANPAVQAGRDLRRDFDADGKDIEADDLDEAE